ncbi:MAG: TRAM domain-containing protein, partial [Christensenellaceae bacterium]
MGCSMKMEKNRELDVLVEDLSPQAQGVAKADGFVVFVP